MSNFMINNSCVYIVYTAGNILFAQQATLILPECHLHTTTFLSNKYAFRPQIFLTKSKNAP